MKRLLLDTNILLWWLSDHPKLGKSFREGIQDANHEVFVSAATTWEISIKRQLGKLHAPENIEREIEHEGFLKLPITLFHGECAGNLPPIHRDPFDRMLIAQAVCENLEMVTADKIFERYQVRLF